METKLIFEKELVLLIKEKPELSALSFDYICNLLYRVLSEKQLGSLNSYPSFKQCRRSATCKKLIPVVRKYLRERYGVFVKQPLSSFKKRITSLSSYEDSSIDFLLQFHQSTKERLDYYPTFFELLFKKLHELGLPQSYTLLDLACGFSPFAYKFIPIKPKKYLAVDLAPKDIEMLNLFFKQTSIPGEAFSFDLLSDSASKWLSNQKVDICFLFKALDSLETVTRHSSKRLLSSLHADFFVVTFSLVTIGGKVPIATQRRSWFENFCNANNWPFESLEIPNELIYIVRPRR